MGEGVAVSIDGVLWPPEEARVSVFDRSFLFGDSVYETLRTYGGQLFAVREHLDRLEASAARLRIPLAAPVETILGWCREAVAAGGNAESMARIVVTRGGGIDYGLDRDLDRAGKVVVLVRALATPPAELYERGVAVVVPEVRRNPPQALDPAVKSGNYLNSIQAALEARDAGAFDAILLDLHDDVAEGTTSSVFVVAGGALRTPPLSTGILDSVTRRLVLRAAARVGVPADAESPVPLAALRSADEVFLASTTKEILPVASIDGARVRGGAPGPVTARLTAALEHEIQRVLARERGEV